MQRRISGFTLAAIACAWTFAPIAHAAEPAYPDRPIRLIVPYPPGGSTDYTGREIGHRLSEVLGQQVVVDNRGGAGSLIGHGLAARATPDGYTLLLGTSTGLSIAPALGTKLAYDPLADFAPIGLAVIAPYLLTLNPSIPATSVSELIEYAQKHPGKLNFGSSGIGTPNHLGGEMLNILAGVKTVHVPYKGGGPALTDLLSGRLQFMFSAIPQVLPHIQSGRLRAIAVGNPKRSRAAPDLPPVADTVPGFTIASAYGLLFPAGTPKARVSRMNAALNQVLAQSELVQRMLAQGVEPAPGTAEEYSSLIRAETERWRKVIESAGISAESIR